MDSDAHRDLEAEPRPHLLAELVHFPGDVQTGLHRPSHVILVGFRVAEHRKQPVALGGENVALVAVDDVVDLLAVATDDGAIDLRFDAGR